jgi:hypothetical protein
MVSGEVPSDSLGGADNAQVLFLARSPFSPRSSQTETRALRRRPEA